MKILSYILVALIAGAVTYGVTVSTFNKKMPEANNPAEKSTQVENPFSTKYYTYAAETDWNKGAYVTRLYRTNKETSKKEIVADNILTLLAASNENKTLEVFSQPQNSDEIFLLARVPESDAGYGNIYAFNTKTTTLSLMNINGTWKGGWNYFLSPDERQFVFVAEPFNASPQKLYYCNLENDMCKILAQLSESETFNKGNGGALAQEFSIMWDSNASVSAEIFDAKTRVSKGIRRYPAE